MDPEPTLRGPGATRREFLGALAGGAALVGLAACGGSSNGAKPRVPVGGTAFFEPASLRSSNGRLEVTLVAAGRMIPFGNGRRFAFTYNGTTPGPTLRVRPGDTLVITLVNHLDTPTNLHTHGLHVSPSGQADNIFVTVAPGAAHQYVYVIPPDHRSGLFWYHPHHHGTVADQVFGGLAGAIIIEDGLDDQTEISASHERLMVLADPLLADSAGGFGVSMMEQMSGREGDVVVVNGVVAPKLVAAAGALERWRVLNASPSRYYRIAVEGHTLHQIGTDGGRLDAPVEHAELLVAPGERAELLLNPNRAGDYLVRALSYDRGTATMGGMGGGGTRRDPTTLLATLAVRGNAARATIPRQITIVEDLRSAAIDRTRTLTLATGMGGGMGGGGTSNRGFTIDGQSFDPTRTDISTRLDTIEEWVVRNSSSMDHPFHLHVWPFQVVDDASGNPMRGWKDTVNVPAGASVRIRVAFRDLTGRTVYHCHILDHEDLGMMGVIDVE